MLKRITGWFKGARNSAPVGRIATTYDFYRKYGIELWWQKSLMGKNYILHPQYERQERHSYPECWTFMNMKGKS